MTLPGSRIGDAVIRYRDAEVRIRAPISKVKSFQDKYGGKNYRLITAAAMNDPVILCDLIVHFQVGTEHTADQIGDWLLDDPAALENDTDFQTMFQREICKFLGVKEEDLARAAADKAAKSSTQKKLEAAHTAIVTSSPTS